MSELTQNNTGYDDLLDLLMEENIEETVPLSETINTSEDLISILDAEYDKSFDADNSIQFSTDYDDNAVQFAEINDDFGGDTDTYDFEDDEDDEDLSVIQELRDSLSNRGYRSLELYDYQQLEQLAIEEALMLDRNYISNQVKLIEINFMHLKDTIMSHSATYLTNTALKKNSDRKVLGDFDLDPQLIYIVDTVINKYIYDNMENLEQLKSQVTLNGLYNRLSSVLPAEYKFYLEDSELFAYLQSAVPYYIGIRCDDYYLIRDMELQRGKTTTFILNGEQKLIDELDKTQPALIKQIFRAGKDIVYHCDCCAKEVPAQSDIVSYIIFASEKNSYETSIIPHIIKCPNCGCTYLLPNYVYEAMSTNLSKCYDKGSDKLFGFLTKIATGTAITKINPPLDVLFSDIDVIVDIPSINKVTVVEETVKQERITTSSLDYKKAIELFYKRLELFDISQDKEDNLINSSVNIDDDIDIESINFASASSSYKDSSKLAARELAICIASELSRNYKELKNKALFSLIMHLDDYTFAQQILNRSEFWQNEADLKLYSKLDNLSDTNQDFLSLIKYTLGSKYKLGMDIQEIKEVAINHREYLLQRNRYMRERYEELVNQIERSTDLLAYTKILNIKQINAKLLFSYLNDSRLLNLFDNITDQMIINNLAEEYASVFFRKSKLNNKQFLQKAIYTIIDSASLIAKLDKALEEKGFYCGNLPMYYDRLNAITANHLAPLRDAADALKRYSFYRFIDALNNFKICNTICSQEENARLEQLKVISNKYAYILEQRYVNFYLKDFNSDDINMLDATYRKKLYSIEFERYVPVRLPGESLSNYIDRYESLINSNGFCDVECIDYSEYFKEFEEYFVTIFAGYNVLSLEDNNFILSNFMRCILQMILREHPKNESLAFLGYTEAFLRRMVNLESYKFIETYVVNTPTLYQVLYGNYITLCGEYIIKYRQLFESKTLSDREDICAVKFNLIDDMVNELYAMSDNDLLKLMNMHKQNKINSDNRTSEVVTDSVDTEVLENLNSLREDMIIELEFYANRILRVTGDSL